ncbi:unnamed protein product [Hermetia illucens]|uniref:Peptidase S1 domain-containing protein n=1 Tax=Hermetia illucens TaxID=343691 RepID=A0A7R8YTL3_HERIL|nr:trypsin alpha-3-like isoform X2 [Hermetia illucens]CAD7084529.1 unnamed protein product [Hermetia illucens]
MKSCFSFILICAILTTFRDVSAYKIPTIMEGTLAVPGQFPWIVFIETPTDISCVGTIVNSKHVLTAAQCVLDEEGKLWNPFWFKIIAGAVDLYNIYPRVVFRKLVAIYVNQNFNLVTLENDLAILRVDKEFPDPHNTIEVAEIYPMEIARNALCQFAGWSPYTLNKQTVQQFFYGSRIQDWSVCQTTRNSENSICAKSVRKSNSCQGNKGAGLFCDGKLIGVFSYGQSCNSTAVPSVYTDVRKFQPWMQEQFIRTDIPAAGSSPLLKNC